MVPTKGGGLELRSSRDRATAMGHDEFDERPGAGDA
jgi:hypothetical protein